MGLYLGLGGILTFKRSDQLRATVRELPLDRLLLETDAPYLAPEPFRGQRNEPAHVVRVAAALAEVKGLSLRRGRGGDHRQLLSSVHQGEAAARAAHAGDGPRLRHLERRALDRLPLRGLHVDPSRATSAGAARS